MRDWNIKNSHDIAKISKIIRYWRFLSEIRILEKIIPGTKKFLKVQKNGFILPEYFSEASVTYWVKFKYHKYFNNLCILDGFAPKHFLKTCALKEWIKMRTYLSKQLKEHFWNCKIIFHFKVFYSLDAKLERTRFWCKISFVGWNFLTFLLFLIKGLARKSASRPDQGF